MSKRSAARCFAARCGLHVAGFYVFLSVLYAKSMHYFSIMESLIEAGHVSGNGERERGRENEGESC